MRSRSSRLTARASSSERSTRGVKTTRSSVRSEDWVCWPNSAPTTGMEDRNGKPLLPFEELSLMSPPSTRVSPERTATLETICRCVNVGVAAVGLTTSVTIWLMSSVTRSPALTEGVTPSMTPVSLYWIVVVV